MCSKNRNSLRIFVLLLSVIVICLQHSTASAQSTPINGWTPFGWRYAFTRPGARAFRTVEAATANAQQGPDVSVWEQGWGLAYREVVTLNGQQFVRSLAGLYVRMEDLSMRQLSRFTGSRYEEIAGDPATAVTSPGGWIIYDHTAVYRTPGENRIRRLPRHLPVHVYETRRAGTRNELFVRIGEDQWVRANRVRMLLTAPIPAEIDVSRRERWVDVDLVQQTLVAYEGDQPVFATLVSTGRQGFATQVGTFRVYDRYTVRTMDNLEQPGLPSHYHMEHVPWVQFFDHDRALHSAYWHGDFGTRRSHGCVNLSVRDGEWLYRFSARRFAPNTANETTEPRRGGMMVRVRDDSPTIEEYFQERSQNVAFSQAVRSMFDVNVPAQSH